VRLLADVNVFEANASTPQKADITFLVNADERTSTWPNAADELKAISFYDEACGDVYLSADSEMSYRPRTSGAFANGRYWARTSDPQLVELVLSQLS
jgi:hypothetical protein